MVTWVTAGGLGLKDIKKYAFKMELIMLRSQKVPSGQFLLHPTFNWLNTLRGHNYLTKIMLYIQLSHDLAVKVSFPTLCKTHAPNNGDSFKIHTGPPKHIFNSWCLLLIHKKNE